MPQTLRQGMVVDAASLAGTEHENQDRWGRAGDIAWVIDGATSEPSDCGTTVGDYVDDLDAALLAESEAGHGALQTLLEAAIGAVKERPAARDGFSATVAMVRVRGAFCEWLVLGDAAVVVTSDRQESVLVSDRRLAKVASGLRAERQRVRTLEGDGLRLHALTARLRVAEAEARNAEGGYWVAGRNPEAAHHAISGESPAVHQIALMSDGVTDGLEAGWWSSVQDAAEDWESVGPQDSLCAMRDALLSLRVTVDDATLVLLRGHR